MEEECRTCRYWTRIAHEDDGVAECRRHAPRPVSRKASDRLVWADYPLTYTSHWCGEHMGKRDV